jgi:hypothetical protein
LLVVAHEGGEIFFLSRTEQQIRSKIPYKRLFPFLEVFLGAFDLEVSKSDNNPHLPISVILHPVTVTKKGISL